LRFAQSYYAFGFWAIVGLIVFFIWAAHHRKMLLERFAEKELLDEIASSVNFKRQTLKHVLIVLALILSVLALMRPQWGFQWRKVKRKGLDIVIALDVSKSMLATDVKPNRLKRSKLAVKDLVKKLNSDRIGLIAFSGTSFLQCPLTVDYSGFLLALDDLDVNTIPKGGTSISSAIKLATQIFEGTQKKHKILVIITDGEDHEGNPLAASEFARKEKLKIYSIGIGTPEGELIQIRDERGKKTFLKDKEGNVVKSRLNEEILQQIALNTNGAYVRSSGAEFGLDYIYEQKLSSIEKREIKAKMSKFYYERFQIPLALALLLLVVEPFVSDRKR